MKDIYTLIRCGICYENFDEKLECTSQSFTIIRERYTHCIKYVFFDINPFPYFMFLSNNLVRIKPFNVFLTITSRDSELNKNIADEFEDRLGFRLNVKYPYKRKEDLIRLGFSKVFSNIEKNPMKFSFFLHDLEQIMIFN